MLSSFLEAFPWTLLTWTFLQWPFLPPLCGRFFLHDVSPSGHCYHGRFSIRGHFFRIHFWWTFLLNTTTTTITTTDTTTDTKYFVLSGCCVDHTKSPNHLPTESLATVVLEVFPHCHSTFNTDTSISFNRLVSQEQSRFICETSPYWQQHPQAELRSLRSAGKASLHAESASETEFCQPPTVTHTLHHRLTSDQGLHHSCSESTATTPADSLAANHQTFLHNTIRLPTCNQKLTSS